MLIRLLFLVFTGVIFSVIGYSQSEIILSDDDMGKSSGVGIGVFEDTENQYETIAVSYTHLTLPTTPYV